MKETKRVKKADKEDVINWLDKLFQKLHVIAAVIFTFSVPELNLESMIKFLTAIIIQGNESHTIFARTLSWQ